MAAEPVTRLEKIGCATVVVGALTAAATFLTVPALGEAVFGRSEAPAPAGPSTAVSPSASGTPQQLPAQGEAVGAPTAASPSTSALPQQPQVQGEALAGNSLTTFGGVQMSVEGGVRKLVGMPARVPSRKYGGIAFTSQLSCPYRLSGEIRDISGRTGSNGGYALGVGHFEPATGTTPVTLIGVGLQYDLGADRIHLVEYPGDVSIETADNAVGVTDNAQHPFSLETTNGASSLMIDGVTYTSPSNGEGCRQPFIRAWENVIEIHGLKVSVQ